MYYISWKISSVGEAGDETGGMRASVCASVRSSADLQINYSSCGLLRQTVRSCPPPPPTPSWLTFRRSDGNNGTAFANQACRPSSGPVEFGGALGHRHGKRHEKSKSEIRRVFHLANLLSYPPPTPQKCGLLVRLLNYWGFFYRMMNVQS